ncbi:hypothetical protein DSECCO2_525110 [anaerobic digester metagenome]
MGGQAVHGNDEQVVGPLLDVGGVGPGGQRFLQGLHEAVGRAVQSHLHALEMEGLALGLPVLDGGQAQPVAAKAQAGHGLDQGVVHLLHARLHGGVQVFLVGQVAGGHRLTDFAIRLARLGGSGLAVGRALGLGRLRHIGLGTARRFAFCRVGCKLALGRIGHRGLRQLRKLRQPGQFSLFPPLGIALLRLLSRLRGLRFLVAFLGHGGLACTAVRKLLNGRAEHEQ